VLLALMDYGITNLVFTAIAGTGAYMVHNLAVNNIPGHIRDAAPGEIAHADKVTLAAASILAAAGVLVNPWVGIPALAAMLVWHLVNEADRDEQIYMKCRAMGLA
jgi:hypothetical protein